MILRDIIEKLAPIAADGNLDREVTGIAYDSRKVRPGEVFVALRGVKTDGHNFIETAIERGASAVIVERNGFPSRKAAKIKVEDSRKALALAAAEFYGHPSAKLKVIGVTGTNGKTTVTYMLKKILEENGLKTGLLGTVSYIIGERQIPATRTTPEALEIQSMMAQMNRADCKACVMEVSSHALDQHRVFGIDFDVAVFTNLTQDHLDYHQSMERYYAAKSMLFHTLGTSKKRGCAVINLDDPYGKRLIADVAVRATKVAYGIVEAAQLRAVDVQMSSSATEFTIEGDEKPLRVRIPLIGRHNIYNSLAALGVAEGLGIGLDRAAKALEKIDCVPGRLDKVNAKIPFHVFVDYAHTDDALKNVLTTLRELAQARLIVVFGCGGNRDTTKRSKMGAVAEQLADFIVLTSDNPRKEDPREIIRQIETGISEKQKYEVVVDRREAIARSLAMAKPNDMVLIAGKGHETYQEFADTVTPFDDKMVVRELLETKTPGRSNP
ncbi:MAG: UDP-N-acetylmuramoyl-L-alanyl-D-glutamate--2,6-diaminopimelate ligase [Verrucomicrobiae bacterium]|nr:UDP-N-acetylmuramoyl-L-alanyl-D-glutamate--2,6-diaminopimelate ligase [Verrucomicrobiae bacterium]